MPQEKSEPSQKKQQGKFTWLGSAPLDDPIYKEPATILIGGWPNEQKRPIKNKSKKESEPDQRDDKDD